MPIRIVLADDHPIFLIGLRAILSQNEALEIIGEASSPDQLMDFLASNHCDVLITDFLMPADEQNDGLRLIERIRRNHPQLPVIVVTMLRNPAIFASIINLGVKGLVSKISLSHELPAAIKSAYAGKLYVADSVGKSIEVVNGVGDDRLLPIEKLSPRELEVVQLLASGLTSREVSERLNRSKQTISAQKMSSMRKLGIQNNAAFFTYVQAHGLQS
jgi:two-component system capsular synthesis response regulator RcsB